MLAFRKCLISEEIKLLAKHVCGRSFYQRPAVVRVGDTLPCCNLFEDFPTNAIQMPDFVMGKNIVLFGVPGAFSPGCSKTHLPGYMKAADVLKKNGIDDIICVSVNDAYVMGAWADHQKAKGKVRMFADPTGCFINALGLGMNLAPLGGFRSMRFSMVVVNNIIRVLQVEPDGTGLTCSLAEALCYQNFTQSKSKLT